jgi:hypothetical protein
MEVVIPVSDVDRAKELDCARLAKDPAGAGSDRCA